MRRYAVIRINNPRWDNGDIVAKYLPDNYSVIVTGKDYIIIGGDDWEGWTLDGYVIPRLVSGMIFAQEIKLEEAIGIAEKGYENYVSA